MFSEIGHSTAKAVLMYHCRLGGSGSRVLVQPNDHVQITLLCRAVHRLLWNDSVHEAVEHVGDRDEPVALRPRG